MGVLQIALDGLLARQRAIAHNVANANTPGYKCVTVSFEDELKKALGRTGGLPLMRTHPDHLPRPVDLSEVRARAVKENTFTMRQDGNNVDLDREMISLAANTIRYQAAAELLRRKLGGLAYVISDGRR